MTWIDDLRPASFRGVPFFIKGHTASRGQRVQVTEVPGKDQAHTETFGKKNGKHSLDAYIVGDDYFNARNLLINALDKVGNGKLVHPYLGNFQILVPDYSWRETTGEMNVVRFSISIVEWSNLELTSEVIDTKTKVADAKAQSLEAQKQSFIEKYDVLGRALTIAKATESSLDSALDSIFLAKRTVSGNVLYVREFDLLKGKISSLVRNSNEMFDALSDMIGFGTNSGDDQPATAENANGSLQDLGEALQLVGSGNAQPLTEDLDDPTLISQEAQKLITITNMASILSFIEFKSANEAESVRKQIFEELDLFLEKTDDDDVYDTLYSLRTVVTEDLDERIRTLPRLIPYIPIVTLPALVISHELYGTIEREQEIIDRNGIQHPAFVPGQVELEVLLNDS